MTQSGRSCAPICVATYYLRTPVLVNYVPSEVRNCALAQYHQNMCAVKSQSRALATFKIRYCIYIASLKTLHWLCVCTVAQFHVR